MSTDKLNANQENMFEIRKIYYLKDIFLSIQIVQKKKDK